MLSQPVRVAVAVVVVGVGVGGCQPPVPTPTSVPVASYRCTPEAGGAEFDCSQRQFDEMVAKDELYAEAEAVYRRFFAEDVRILRAGGISEPSAELLATTTGDFRRDSMDYYQSLMKDATRLVGGHIELAELVRRPGVAKGDSVVAMQACTDATSTRMVTAGTTVGKGRAGRDLLYFVETDGALRIQGADGQEVERC